MRDTTTKTLEHPAITTLVDGIASGDGYFQDDYFQNDYFQVDILYLSGNLAKETISLDKKKTTVILNG
jgi:hypothetical protein